MGIEECLWSWGSPRLIGRVPGTEGAQNGVSSERKEGRKKNKKREGEEKKNEGKEERRKKEKERDSLDPGGRGLSHFEEDFLQI